MSEELLEAVAGNDGDTVRRLLDTGAGIDTRDAEGRTLLMMAAREGYLETTQLLLDRGVDLNARTEDGGTALMSAAKAGKCEIVRLLLEHGASVNIQNKRGLTALISAVMSGDADIVGDLLDAGADPDLSGEVNGPLHFAASLGRAEILRRLVQHGAAVNVLDAHSTMTPLGAASSRGHIDCVRILLDAGANPDGSHGQSVSPLRGAIVLGHQEIVRALLDHGARTVDEDGVGALMLTHGHPEMADLIKGSRGMDLHDAAGAGDSDRVRALIQERPDVDRRDDRAHTALMMAAEAGQEECAGILLEHGADPNAADEYQHNALIRAASRGHTAIVKLLLGHGADLRAVNRWGQTALHRAALGGHKETVDLLIASGATVGPAEAALSGSRETLEPLLTGGIDSTGAAGMTALMGAAAAGRLELVRELLDRGANPAIADRLERTALHWAVNRGHLDVAELLLSRAATRRGAETLLQVPIGTENIAMIRLLIAHGVDPNSLDKLRSCALRTAVIANKEAALEALLDLGADPNGPTGAHVTPLIEAARTGKEGIVRILLSRGADPNRTDENGRTALEEAAGRGQLPTVTQLLDAGAQITAGKGLGAHVAAAVHGHADIVRLLLERGGAEMLKPDDHGLPAGAGPLLIAAALGKTEILDIYRAGGEIGLPETVKKLQDVSQLFRGGPPNPESPAKTPEERREDL